MSEASKLTKYLNRQRQKRRLRYFQLMNVSFFWSIFFSFFVCSLYSSKAMGGQTASSIGIKKVSSSMDGDVSDEQNREKLVSEIEKELETLEELVKKKAKATSKEMDKNIEESIARIESSIEKMKKSLKESGKKAGSNVESELKALKDRLESVGQSIGKTFGKAVNKGLEGFGSLLESLRHRMEQHKKEERQQKDDEQLRDKGQGPTRT